MKYPKVAVENDCPSYEVKVTVYRHVTTPDVISVRILEIRPLPPEPLVKNIGDGELEVVTILTGAAKETLEVEKAYPHPY